MPKGKIITILIFWFPLTIFSQKHLSRQFQSTLDGFFHSNKTDGSIWSCSVHDIRSDERIYSLNSGTALIPASNQKLLSLSSSLLWLGPHYRSRTIYLSDGPIRKGKLHGNLIIAGYGAIHFTARFPNNIGLSEKNLRLEKLLNNLAFRLENLGISEIEGKVMTDCSKWTDMGENHHYPSAAPLLFHENTLEIEIRNGNAQYCPTTLFGFEPEFRSWRGKQRKVYRKGKPTDHIEISLDKESKDYWRLDKFSPITYYRMHIESALKKRGLTINGNSIEPPAPVNPDYRVLFELASLPLESLIKYAGQNSDNLRAELIFLNLGYVVHGKANYANASQAVVEILRKNGLEMKNVVVDDGSGLSRKNHVSSMTLLSLLNRMQKSVYKEEFIHSLAISGTTGTLKNRFRSKKLKGRVVAKTGTLKDVAALSGYILKDGKPLLTFSFLCNKTSSQGRTWKILEKAVEFLVSHVD